MVVIEVFILLLFLILKVMNIKGWPDVIKLRTFIRFEEKCKNQEKIYQSSPSITGN